MGKGWDNSKFLLILVAFSSLVFVFNPVFAESSDEKISIAYDSVGKAISLGANVQSPFDYPTSASIEFVFEDIDSGNYWDAKKHSNLIEPNSSFVTNQSYFVQNTGKFFIHFVYDVDGKKVKNTETMGFIIFEEYSDAALNGCISDHKMIIKPNYSKAVCVFDDTVQKLAQRGWVDTITKINKDSEDDTSIVQVHVETSDDFYFTGDEIEISGQIWVSGKQNFKEIPVTIQVRSDNDDLVEIAQVPLSSDSHFSHQIKANGPLWQQSGRYVVSASYDSENTAEESFGFSTYYDDKSEKYFINLNTDDYEELCGYPVTDEMRLDIIHNTTQFTLDRLPYFEIHKGNFTHSETSLYLTEIPFLQYWFELDDGKVIYFEIEACDIDDSNMTLGEIGPNYKKSQDVVIDGTHYAVLGAPGYPLIYKDTLLPLLDVDNCKRVAEGYTADERGKLFTRDNTTHEPRWQNQIFPLMDYCTDIGDYELKTADGNINWSFTLK